MANHELLEDLLALAEPQRLAALRQLSKVQQLELATHWRLWARRDQLPPAGDWRLWLVLAGRGFGKTRAGAEWVRALADANPQARIALVGASLGEVRSVMIEGESGVLAICPPDRCPVFEPSLKRLTWPNGAQATLYSALEPESLRGPQHSHACRTGAEGNLRQRGCRANRRTAARRGGKRTCCATGIPRRRPQLADRQRGKRRMDRKNRPDCGPSGWKLALCPAPRRHADSQQGNRAEHLLQGQLAGTSAAGVPHGRSCCRRRGPRRDRCCDCLPDIGRDCPAAIESGTVTPGSGKCEPGDCRIFVSFHTV